MWRLHLQQKPRFTQLWPQSPFVSVATVAPRHQALAAAGASQGARMVWSTQEASGYPRSMKGPAQDRGKNCFYGQQLRSSWCSLSRHTNLFVRRHRWQKCGGPSTCLLVILLRCSMWNEGFPCGSAGKESAYNVGDLGSIPGLGRSPGEGQGYSLQYSGLENPVDCIVLRVANSWTPLSDFQFTFEMILESWNTKQVTIHPSALPWSLADLHNPWCMGLTTVSQGSQHPRTLSSKG